MLKEQCKRQHCCAKLRRSGNKKKLGSCWLKRLTGFKLCATIPNNTQQQATTCNRVCKRTCASASGFSLIDMNTWQWDTNMCFESLGWGQCSRFDSRLLDRTQQITSNNAGSCWPTMLPPSHGAKNLLTRKLFVKFFDHHEQFRLDYQPLIGNWAHALPALLLLSLLGADTRERRKSSIPRPIPFAGSFFVLRKPRLTLLKSQISWQLVVYHQCCVLICWATTRLYVIAQLFGGKKGLKSSFI